MKTHTLKPLEDNELLDVVNENNEVIGVEKRVVIHAKKLRHRSVNLIIFNKDKTKILIQKRSLLKQKCPGLFCLVGGHIDSLEDPLDASVREFSEEMLSKKNCDIDLSLCFIFRNEADGDHEFTYVYEGTYNGNFNTNNEVSDCSYVEVGELIKNIDSQPQMYTEKTILVLKTYNLLNLKNTNQ